MAQTDSSVLMEDENRDSSPGDGGDSGRNRPRPPVPRRADDGLFKQYKPDQGKMTRTGTVIGVWVIVAWGGKFLYDRLQVFQGDEAWRLLITTGIPMFFAVVAGGVAWWFIYVHTATSDFMIATEGEMKKVSWSSRSEIIGSTKVVILFTILMALLLFLADLFFQFFFSALGVLKT